MNQIVCSIISVLTVKFNASASSSRKGTHISFTADTIMLHVLLSRKIGTCGYSHFHLA